MYDNVRRDRRPGNGTRFRPRFGPVSMLLAALMTLLVVGYFMLPYVADYTLAGAAPTEITSRSRILRLLIRVSLASEIPGFLARVSGVILAVLVVIGLAARFSKQPRVSARLRLTASYALFLVVASGVLLVGIYLVLRYVPSYPLMPSSPGELQANGASRHEILNALVRVSGVILFGMALIGIGGGWILAGWILRPLQRINEAAQIAATGRLDHHVRLADRGDEFGQLADSFDHMLDRLHDAFTAQERFAANASHELRTPLSVNATLLDVARLNPDEQDYETLVERLRITNARAIGLTEALLRLADANSIMANSMPIDLSEVVREAIAESADEAESHQVSLVDHLGTAPTMGDATLLRQLVTNLIQNAIRHNTAFGFARIVTEHDPLRSIVTLHVENSGRRYTPDQVATFTEPFLRGDGRIRQSAGERGYGLGLALVSRIVAVHGGSLALAPRAEGGLVAVAIFRCHVRAATNETERVRRRVRPTQARPHVTSSS